MLDYENTLTVIAAGRFPAIILRVSEGKVYSNLVPGDVGNLKALIRFEDEKKPSLVQRQLKN